MSRRWWACGFALFLMSFPAFALTTKSVGGELTAQNVADLLVGPGATITNLRVTGSNLAIGSFSEGGAIGIESGVVLSTGNIDDATGANDSDGSGASLGFAGHPALNAIVAPHETHDATIIEFDVVTVSPTFTIRYVFASEEYREYVGTEFNDVFAFFVDGGNIAITPGTAVPVTVNTINHLSNTSMYRDNEGGAGTQFDGYTIPLLAVAVVEPNVSHHIRIAIADTSDAILDSAVFIAQGGISGSQIAPLVFPQTSAIEARFGEAATVGLALHYAFESSPPQLSASGIPGATFTFTPLRRTPDGQVLSELSILIGPDTPAGEYPVTIESRVGEAVSYSTIIVVVECKPPAILGTGQPQTQVVERGQAATLTATASGSNPQTYQWYVGHRGMSGSPVPGATGPTLTTGAVNEATAYWLRVSNPCGTFDSNTVFVMPR